MTYEIEITRNNVTPAKFFAEIRFACKKKGIDFGLELEQFVNPIQPSNHHYAVINGKKVCYAGNYRYIEPAEFVGTCPMIAKHSSAALMELATMRFVSSPLMTKRLGTGITIK